MSLTRAERERIAYDEQGVWEVNDGWHRRFPHVFSNPNTARHERLFESLIEERVPGGRLFEVGCGFGDFAERLLPLNPLAYYGLDVSEDAVRRAHRLAEPGRVRFEVADAHDPLQGEYDLIFGQSVLHHIDFKTTLERWYRENLAPGGRMVFAEPMQGGLMLRLYWRLAPGAHTPDERPLGTSDMHWLRQTFPGFQAHAFNYASFGTALLTSRLGGKPDGTFGKFADRLDTSLHRLGWPTSWFRRAILVIDKPRS